MDKQSCFKSYIKRIDNGRDLDSSGNGFQSLYFYNQCYWIHILHLQSCWFEEMAHILIFYKFTMSVVMGFVISDNYFMYR